MERFSKALRYSFLLLKYRARSTQELQSRLQRRKFDPGTIERVLAYLKEHDCVDDNRFAASFARARLTKGYGRRRIAFDLKKLGISDKLIEEELCRVDRQEYVQLIREHIRRRQQKCAPTNQARAKIFRYLLQRGFEADEIKRAMEELY